MKKVMLLLFIIMFAAWGYYFWGNRKRFFNSPVIEETDYTARVEAERKLKALQEKYDYLLKLCSDTTQNEPPKSEPVATSQSEDSRVEELIAENTELRRELDQIKSQRNSQPKPSQTVNSKKSNEKNIPIARNNRAVELQKFLTDLYGDR